MWLLPSGFPEYTPSQQIVFDKIKHLIEEKYKSFGYSHIHTPAIESNKILLAKSGEETGKQIFGLYWLAQWAEDLKDYSLHFDLTIPFARYVLDHESELVFPFKRYQIQAAWRWERAQRWRFREFWQCDIDTVWRADSSSSTIFYDAETLIVMAEVFAEIQKIYPSIPNVAIHYNDRRFLWKLLDHYPNKSDLYSLFDKYYKIWEEKFNQELQNLVWEEESEKIKFQIQNPDKNPELLELEKYISQLNINNLKLIFDPFITRWLDYYTGMVYETFFENEMSLGSISSGWRYENLTTYIDPKRNFSGVWWSIGISRLVSLILEKESDSIGKTTDYLCLNFLDTLEETIKLANKLRSEWNIVEIYPSPDKLWKQFSYADKKKIPLVLILWDWEKSEWIYKIKNMKTWIESSYDL